MISILKKLTKPKNILKNKIGILYVCTGKYHIFWENFYLSAKKHFCKNSEVHFFVFSDTEINTFNDSTVSYFYQPRLGWPYDTLHRFHMFLSHKEHLIKMNYLYFFNANMIFFKNITEKMILPDTVNYPSALVSVVHPCHYESKSEDLIYERNKESKAYIKPGEGSHYFQGCLSGGEAKSYLKMCADLKENIDNDDSRKIIALWWDESHMNHYFLTHHPKPLHPGYAHPEDMRIPFKKLIVQLDKSKYGGHDQLRK